MWLLYAFLSSIFAAGVAIVGKIGLKNIDSTLATTIRSIIMAVFLIILSLISDKFNGFSINSLSNNDWLFIILAGILGALSWLFYFFALKDGPVNGVVAIDRLSIVFVFVFSLLFLKEHFTIKGLIGVILMVFGAILISIK
ncbi:MAG TPA: EamA family transporter [bacterium]|nr:EamA family transporter [Bacteroidales bacterium]HPO11273.1 EamA family transporter [bacterium]